MRVLRLSSAKSADNAVLFFSEVLSALPFPIQRIRKDWGTEFFNDALQEELMVHYVNFRSMIIKNLYQILADVDSECGSSV